MENIYEFLMKTVSKPFGIFGDLLGSNLESIETIPFHFLQDSLVVDQINTLEKIAKFKKRNLN